MSETFVSSEGGIFTLLSAKTATGAGAIFNCADDGKRTFQADGTTSSGAGSATITVEVSINKVDWMTLGTVTLTLATTSSSDGFASDAAWPYVRGNVTAISGTGASVNLRMGV